VNARDILRYRAAAAAETAASYAEILKLNADADVVLIGEASNGTPEFYRERAVITHRLIEEHGFTAVAVEADWPDALRPTATFAATTPTQRKRCARFPTWMWRNADLVDFVGWLRDHNDGLDARHRVGLWPGSL